MCPHPHPLPKQYARMQCTPINLLRMPGALPERPSYPLHSPSPAYTQLRTGSGNLWSQPRISVQIHENVVNILQKCRTPNPPPSSGVDNLSPSHHLKEWLDPQPGRIPDTRAHTRKLACAHVHVYASRQRPLACILSNLQEWLTPQPSRWPDIFPEFERLQTPDPKPMPGDPEQPDEEEMEDEDRKRKVRATGKCKA